MTEGREWYEIQNGRGSPVGVTGTWFGSEESALKDARQLLASGAETAVTVLRCASRPVKILTRTSAVEETVVSA